MIAEMTTTSPELQKKLAQMMQENFLSFVMAAVAPAAKGDRVTSELQAGHTSLAILSEAHYYTLYLTRDQSSMTVDIAVDGTNKVDEIVLHGDNTSFKHMIHDVTAALNKNPAYLHEKKKIEKLQY